MSAAVHWEVPDMIRSVYLLAVLRFRSYFPFDLLILFLFVIHFVMLFVIHFVMLFLMLFLMLSAIHFATLFVMLFAILFAIRSLSILTKNLFSIVFRPSESAFNVF